MKIDKNTILRYLIYIIVLVILNGIYYGLLGGLHHSVSAWISYVFIHLSFIAIVATPFFVQNGRDQALFSYTTHSISLVYFIIEFILGAFIILISPGGYKFALFSQIILMAAYFIILFVNVSANERTAASVEKHEEELVYVKKSCAALKPLLYDVTDRELSRKVERVYDIINSSPTKSHPDVKDLENSIMNEVDNLCWAIQSGKSDDISELSDKIVHMAEERNSRLRQLNW